MKATTKQLTRQQLEEIARQPGHIVMDVEDVEAQDSSDGPRPLLMRELRPILLTARAKFLSLKATRPELSDTQLRNLVLGSPELAPHKDQLLPNYEMIFSKYTSSSTTEDHLRQLTDLMAMREQVEKGSISAQDATSHLWKHYTSAATNAESSTRPRSGR